MAKRENAVKSKERFCLSDRPTSPGGMCRLLVVKSTTPVLLAHILTAPAHSIINQASDSRLRLDARSINADGFGVGWYPTAEEHDDENKPCIFRMSVFHEHHPFPHSSLETTQDHPCLVE